MTTRSDINRKAASRASCPDDLSTANGKTMQDSVDSSSTTDELGERCSVRGASAAESLLHSVSGVPGTFSEPF